MKFLVDVNVSPVVAKWLRDQGYDAVHLFELDLHTLEDIDIWAKAAQETRIIVTCDLDFPYLLSISEQSLPSVILFRLEYPTSENEINWLKRIFLNTNEALIKGAIVTISDSKVRVRHLPLY